MKNNLNEDIGIKDWKTIQTFVDDNTQFSDGQIRWLLRNKEQNGLIKAVRKIGRKIYIHESLFNEWIFSKEGQYE